MTTTMTHQALSSVSSIPAADAASEALAVSGAPLTLLRLEGAAALLAASFAYAELSGRWAVFAALFLLPDLSMLGYLAGRRAGAACYNAGHSYLGPAALAGLGAASNVHALLCVACIWVAHVGFDRLLGYGLKYGTSFGDTHLGRRGANPMIRKSMVSMATALLLLAAAPNAFADAPEVHGFNLLPEHHFQWAPSDAKQVQAGINFGLLQIALGGFNVAGEVRYRRLWLEYSHGMNLTLNDAGGLGLSQAERDQNLHVFVPYTTGFGAGVTLVDELWLGVEWKTHHYEVSAPGGPVSSYQTYSVGPVLGYKAFIWKGLYANGYARYWPNVASTLGDNRIALAGNGGTVTHSAHDVGLFANVSLGYAFDL